MSILDVATNPIAGWALSGFLGIWHLGDYIAKKVTSLSSDAQKVFIEKAQHELDLIKDDKLRRWVLDGIRYAAAKMPDASDNDKLQFVIEYAQKQTPDWLISDEKIKVTAESIYSDWKATAEKLTA